MGSVTSIAPKPLDEAFRRWEQRLRVLHSQLVCAAKVLDNDEFECDAEMSHATVVLNKCVVDLADLLSAHDDLTTSVECPGRAHHG